MARWALIASESGEDSRAHAARIVARLGARGLSSEGFLQLRTADERGRKRFEIERLGTGERATLAVHRAGPLGPTEERFCSMAFRGDGFEVARRWVAEDAPKARLLVLSGLSKLEVSGRGHAPALREALRDAPGIVLLCARSSQLFHLVERFGLEEEGLVAALELPAGPAEVEAFVTELERGVEMAG